MNLPEDRKTDTGLTPEAAIVLAYLFLWLGGILFLVLEKRNRFVRFHAMQSTIMSLAAGIVLVLLTVLQFIPLLGVLIAWIVKPSFVIAFWIVVIVLIVKVTGGRNIRLPIIADLADLWLVKLEQPRQP